MNRHTDFYTDFVAHPRYGRGPRFTGLHPVEDRTLGINFGWRARPGERISKTAIAANTDRQLGALVPVTHYFDLKRQCRDCGRSFIFFAEEQRHWYETLHFHVGADCVRCTECRVNDRHTKRLRKRYQSLLHKAKRSDLDDLRLAETAMRLIDLDVFGHRCIERVRSLVNAIPLDSQVRRHATFRDVDVRSAAWIRDRR